MLNSGLSCTYGKGLMKNTWDKIFEDKEQKFCLGDQSVPTRARARARLIRNENQVEDKKIFLGILFTLKFYIENDKLCPNALTLLLFELLRIIQFLAIDIGWKIDPQFGSYRGVEGWNPQFCMYLASM